MVRPPKTAAGLVCLDPLKGSPQFSRDFKDPAE
jgi:hypothetical protein